MSARAELWVCQLGLVEYREALELQTRLRAARMEGRIPDTLLLLEHPPVYTRGRRTQEGELPFPAEWYAERGIDIADVERGGHVTYHGPGMLTGYTIMQVPQVHPFVATLEDAMIAALAEQGVAAGRRESTAAENLTGVWVGERKIGSIGLHLSRGYAMHGFAINVVNDLTPFTWIVPCGLGGVQMTSVAAELAGDCGADPMDCMRRRTAFAVAQAFGVRQRLVSRDRLEALAGAAPAPV
ncbi:MAG: lipoyl(octanoyl) transferase LipB [Solirubrobacteraceae bacterium]|nr:lipoyl(octanoyl) transferase LipB [Solirubrobacteraceae bacterium]